VEWLTRAAFAWLAAVYLCVEATDDRRRDDFRARALWTLGVLAAPILLTPLLALEQAGQLFRAPTPTSRHLPTCRRRHRACGGAGGSTA